MKYFCLLLIVLLSSSCAKKSSYKIEIEDAELLESTFVSMDTLLRKVNNELYSYENAPCRFSINKGYIFFSGNKAGRLDQINPSINKFFTAFTAKEFILFKQNIQFLNDQKITSGYFDSVCQVYSFLYRRTSQDTYYDTEWIIFLENEEDFHCIEERYHIMDRKERLLLGLKKDI